MTNTGCVELYCLVDRSSSQRISNGDGINEKFNR
jgi:hypothetical protein